MAIFSLYVVIWSCTYTVPIYCLSISVYIYSVTLYYLSNDGLASFEPSSHLWLFQYPVDYSCTWISWKYNKSSKSNKWTWPWIRAKVYQSSWYYETVKLWFYTYSIIKHDEQSILNFQWTLICLKPKTITYNHYFHIFFFLFLHSLEKWWIEVSLYFIQLPQ